MSHTLYTVTLTDLGTYEARVAASSPNEAEKIARGMLAEEGAGCLGLKTIKREAEANAVPANDPPVRQWRVAAMYRVAFALTVPGASADEAVSHAKRLYDINMGPYEFDIGDERAGPFTAEEVVA